MDKGTKGLVDFSLQIYCYVINFEGILIHNNIFNKTTKLMLQNQLLY